MCVLVKKMECSRGFPGGKESNGQCRTCKKCGLDPWVGKIPWRREGYPLQSSCLGNPMDRGDWWATVHGVAKSQTRLTCTYTQDRKEREGGRKERREEKRENFNQASFPGVEEKPFAISS